MTKKTLSALAGFAVIFAAPAHADCQLHCPVPSYDDLEQRTCYVLDKNAATPNERLIAATAMSLKFDLDIITAKMVVDNAISDYCPWER